MDVSIKPFQPDGGDDPTPDGDGSHPGSGSESNDYESSEVVEGGNHDTILADAGQADFVVADKGSKPVVPVRTRDTKSVSRVLF